MDFEIGSDILWAVSVYATIIIITVGLLLLGIPFAVITIIAKIYFILKMIDHQKHFDISTDNYIQKQELLMKYEHTDQKYNNNWITIYDKINNNKYKVHSIVIQNIDQKRPTLLFIHGIGGSAMSFRRLYKYFTYQFNIVAVNLPGFGISEYPPYLLNANTEEISDWYSDFMVEYLKEMKIVKPIVIGHSMGGFLSIKTAKKYPDLFNKLVLVASAGMFPSFGNMGGIWSLFFKFGLPTSLVKNIGNLGTWVYTIWGILLNFEPDYYYYVQSFGSKLAINDYIVSKFIQIDYITGYWKNSSFTDLLQLKIPVSLIYGGRDTIVPTHQGIIIKRITDNKIPLSIIKDGTHNLLNNDKEFVDEFINKHLNNNFIFDQNIHGKLVDEINKHDFNNEFKSSFDILKTDITIRKMYDKIYGIYHKIKKNNT